MDVLTKIYNVVEEYGDSRVKSFWLMNGPFYMLGIVAAYLSFCLWIGPAIMKNREPFKLQRMIQAYNIFQVIVCTWFSITGAIVTYMANINYICEPRNSRTDYWYMQILHYHWYYMIIKLLDLLDTVFFVLRKKTSHVTFLHLYHHTLLVIFSWCFTIFIPGAEASLTGILNSFVHIWMYSYYLITSLGPKYSKYASWKIWITRLQIVQFVVLFIQNLLSLLITCSSAKIGSFFLVVQNGIFLYLFLDFYNKTYTVKCPLFDEKKKE